MTVPSPPILTVPEVGAYLRISRAMAYRLVRRGEIPSFRLGNAVRVRHVDLMDWVERRVVAVDTHYPTNETGHKPVK